MKIKECYFPIIKLLIEKQKIEHQFYFTDLKLYVEKELSKEEEAILPNVFYWNPLEKLFPTLYCPKCNQDGVKSILNKIGEWHHGQSKSQIPRAIWDDGWYCALVGKTYFCQRNHSVASYHAGILDQIPFNKLPFILSFKSGMTRSLFDRLARYVDAGMSFNNIETLLGGFFLDQCYRKGQLNGEELEKSEILKAFGSFAPTHHLIRQCFVIYFHAYKHLYQRKMNEIAFNFISFDHTFKIASNIGYHKDNKWIKAYDSMFIVLNETGFIKSYKFTKGTALEKVETVLTELKEQGEPKLIFVDNCCMLRNQINHIFPAAEVKLDIFHAIQRLIKTISKKHSFCAEFSKRLGLIFRQPGDIEDQRKMKTPCPEQMISNLNEFIDDWKDVHFKGWNIINENFFTEAEKLKKHINNGCLANIPVGQGTNRNENLHKNLKRIFNTKKMGIETADALFAQVIYSHNSRKTENRIVPPIWTMEMSKEGLLGTSVLLEANSIFQDIEENWSGDDATDHCYGKCTACKFAFILK